MAASSTSHALSPLMVVVRVLWTLLTYPLVLVAALLGLPFGLARQVAAWWRGERGWWFALRAGVLSGAISGARIVFEASTALYGKLFAQPMAPGPSGSMLADPSRFLIVGHRGAPYARVENTIGSCARALQEGANALEVDLSMTSDGHIVLWHDWDPHNAVALFRENGLEPHQAYRPFFPENELRRQAHLLTLAELRSHYGYCLQNGAPLPEGTDGRIPTLDEFLVWARQQGGLKAVFWDIKLPPDLLELAPQMLAAMDASLELHCPDFESVMLTPYEPVFHAFAKSRHMRPCLDREVVSAITTGSASEMEGFSTVRTAEVQGTAYATVGRPTFLTLAPWELYQGIVRSDLAYRQRHSLDIRLVAWTINESEELKALLRFGVDGILTDRPYRLAGHLLGRKSKDLLLHPRELFRRAGQAKD